MQTTPDLKKYIFTLVLLLCAVLAQAQRQRFDPGRFEADLERFVVTEAGLSPVEASRFFPVYREMRRKQMAVFYEDKNLRHVDLSNEKACAEVIRKHDENDLSLKKIQRDYHARFLKILPASKVLRIIRAEDKFHRRAFRNACKPGRNE